MPVLRFLLIPCLAAFAGGCLVEPVNIDKNLDELPANFALLSQKQRDSIDHLKKRGGKIIVGGSCAEYLAISADLHGIHLNQVDLEALVDLVAVHNINFFRTPVNDNDLACLRTFVNLQSLNLNATRVTDNGLTKLQGFSFLHQLYLSNLPITDAGLKNLTNLPNLQELSLYHTHVTDAGLEHLKNFPHLQHVTLSGKDITDGCIKHLLALKELREVDFLDRTRVTKAGIIELRTKLREVKVAR